ncbi:hypothetical protein BC332_12619 [Capsicum chinense]|nr:hypothetical protein BC332_12619 [Capsicum chinense]
MVFKGNSIVKGVFEKCAKLESKKLHCLRPDHDHDSFLPNAPRNRGPLGSILGAISISQATVKIKTGRLIQLWITESFIRTSGSRKSLEEVAVYYLVDLISRNLIQARKRRFSGEIKTCGLHDILYDFCLIEADTIKFLHVERIHPTLPAPTHNVRRFSFQSQFCSGDDFLEKAYSVDYCCKLLTPVAGSIYLFSLLLLPFAPYIKLLGILPIYRHNPIIHEFFSSFNLLRVLAIINIDLRFRSLPLVITKLFHLRYLQVQFDGDIQESISELPNLQTLVCSGYHFDITLPLKIWMMKNLRARSGRKGSNLSQVSNIFKFGLWRVTTFAARFGYDQDFPEWIPSSPEVAWYNYSKPFDSDLRLYYLSRLF